MILLPTLLMLGATAVKLEHSGAHSNINDFFMEHFDVDDSDTSDFVNWELIDGEDFFDGEHWVHIDGQGNYSCLDCDPQP